MLPAGKVAEHQISVTELHAVLLNSREAVCRPTALIYPKLRQCLLVFSLYHRTVLTHWSAAGSQQARHGLIYCPTRVSWCCRYRYKTWNLFCIEPVDLTRSSVSGRKLKVIFHKFPATTSDARVVPRTSGAIAKYDSAWNDKVVHAITKYRQRNGNLVTIQKRCEIFSELNMSHGKCGSFRSKEKKKIVDPAK